APGAMALTVVENVTVWPYVDGFGVPVTLASEVAAWLIVCVSVLELLALKLPSPRYETVIVCVPIGRVLAGVKTYWPLALRFTDGPVVPSKVMLRSEEHTSELQSRGHLVCRLLLEK